MQSPISFKSYTASYITNLDNSLHPCHSSSSTFSSHTPYQSASRMLCNTIHASFSTKKCTEPHILFQLITQFRFSPFCLHVTQRWLFSLFIHPLSHCCSTSSLNEIIPLFSDSIRISESADRSVRRDASLAVDRCLHRSYQENDLLITRWTVNVFNYILFAILNFKPEFWPSAIREEWAESSHSSTSLFGFNLFFLHIAPSNPEDPVMRAMLELSVMNVEKEMSIVIEGRRSNSEDDRLRWIDDAYWKMFKVSHLREIDRTNE